MDFLVNVNKSAESELRICSNLLKKILTEIFIFCCDHSIKKNLEIESVETILMHSTIL